MERFLVWVLVYFSAIEITKRTDNLKTTRSNKENTASKGKNIFL